MFFQACNSRRKRSLTPFGEESNESATVSVGPLYTARAGTHVFSFTSINIKIKLFFNWPPLSSLAKDTSNAAAYSEYVLILRRRNTFSYVGQPLKIIFTHLCLRLSGNNMASENDDDDDVTGLVVGVVFGTAAAVALVLGGWFVLKKLDWV